MDMQGDLPRLTNKFILAGFDMLGEVFPDATIGDRPDHEIMEDLHTAVSAAIADWIQKNHMGKIKAMSQRIVSGDWKNESTQIREMIREEIAKFVK